MIKMTRYLIPVLVSISVYTCVILTSRYLDMFNVSADWLWLVGCALLPLFSPVYRRLAFVPNFILTLNFIFLATLTFWLIAVVFGEGP